jgi:hypothetical protein
VPRYIVYIVYIDLLLTFRLPQVGAYAIADALGKRSSLCSLENLLLAGNNIRDEGAKAIISALCTPKNRNKGSQTVVCLDLANNDLTSGVWEDVCRLIRANTPLKTLRLRGNKKLGDPRQGGHPTNTGTGGGGGGGGGGDTAAGLVEAMFRNNRLHSLGT